MQQSWTEVYDTRVSTFCVPCHTDGTGTCEDTKQPKSISLLMYFGLYVTERFIVQKILAESHEFSSARSSVAVSIIIYILLGSLSP